MFAECGSRGNRALCRKGLRQLHGLARLGSRIFINNGRVGARDTGRQFLVLGGKGARSFARTSDVTAEDIRKLAYPTLRHRILLTTARKRKGITVDEVIKRLLEATKAPTVS